MIFVLRPNVEMQSMVFTVVRLWPIAAICIFEIGLPHIKF